MVNEAATRGAARDDGKAAARSARTATALQRAIEDLTSGTAHWWIWSSMAWQDIRLRYRGSILGPFWLTISMGVMIATMGLLYAKLFHQEIGTYLPYVTLGLLFWTFIASMANEGCTCFVNAEPIIRQVRMPFTIHVHRTLYRNLIILAHNAVVYIALILWFDVPLNLRSLLVLPGIAALLVNGMWVCILFGMLSARFRDIGPIVGSFMQIFFFMTPVFWDPSSLSGRLLWLVEFNPFYAMLQIVRAPLLGQPVPSLLWWIVIATTVVGCSFTFAFFARFRARIPFWV